MTSTVPTSSSATRATRPGLVATSILVISNLMPLAGILFWGWDAFVMLCLYWLEIAVVGFWTILRVATMSQDRGSVAGRSIAGALAIGGFFTVHAGIFMTVHMVFLWTLFAGPWAARLHGARDFIRLIVIGQGLWMPLLALFIGQGAIFINDAVNRFVFAKPSQESTEVGDIMGGFYSRIVLLHVAIMGGAFIAEMIGTAAPLIVLVLVKTALEIRFQSRQWHAARTKAA